jgi:hypothetical protein
MKFPGRMLWVPLGIFLLLKLKVEESKMNIKLNLKAKISLMFLRLSIKPKFHSKDQIHERTIKFIVIKTQKWFLRK